MYKKSAKANSEVNTPCMLLSLLRFIINQNRLGFGLTLDKIN